MYKLVIVDDEQIIREGIAMNTDFASLNIRLVGSCENGIDALEVIKEEEPDIVMTDINMPFMNGMELAEEVLALYPLTKIIFLTGYDRFEYVKQALRLKITDYLVKPILPKELLKVFNKVIKTIDQQRVEDDKINRLKERVAETEPVLKDRFLNRLIKGPVGTPELEGCIRNHHIDMDMGIGCYQALCINVGDENTTVQDYNELDSNLRTAMAIIMSFTEGIRDCVVFRTYFDRIAILLGGDELNDVTETGDLLADRIYSGLGSSMPIFIGIGKPVLHFEDISRSYNTATEVLEFRVFNGKHAISSYMDLDRKRGKSQLTLSGYAAAIHKEVKNGTLKALLQIIDEAFGELSDHTMPIENYYLHVQSLLTSIILSLDEQGIDYKDICRDAKNPILHLHSMKSLEEMKGWLKDLCRDILDYVVAEQEDYQAGQAKGAVAYIENHYADGDISLKKICKDLCMSVSYFSQIFKEETGTTFVDYLTGLRMEKAKDLLRNTSDKTYEIAAAVGYKDAHYFSLVFKKQVGMTATAFRDSITMTKI